MSRTPYSGLVDPGAASGREKRENGHVSWLPDTLGPGFVYRALPLLDDDFGTVTATLVRHDPTDDPGALPHTPSTPSFALLHLHGWNDYTHNRELARFVSSIGGAFYGLDLRRYGRNLKDGDLPGYVDSLSVYDEDIHAALGVIRQRHGYGVPLALMGHSTGGLTAALWAHRHPGALTALILNSPWLALQGSWVLRALGGPVVETLARRIPTSALPVADNGFYHRVLTGWTDDDGARPEDSLGDPFYEGWGLDPRYRHFPSMPIRPGWLNAVMEGHDQVAEGLTITCPVLVLSSTRTLFPNRWLPDLRGVDSVLDVEQIAEQALNLGPLVTLARFEGAIHDVLLSAGPIRRAVYREMDRWSRAYVPGYVAKRSRSRI